MVLRRVGVAAGVAVMVFGVTSCGPQEAPTSQSVADTSAGSGAAALTAASFSSQIAQAQADGVTGHVEATLNVLGQPGSVSGDFSVGQDVSESALDLAVDLGDRTVAVRLVDDQLYVAGLGLSSDRSRPWIRMDLSDAGSGGSALPMLEAVRPENWMTYFDAVSSVEDRGAETVDGVDTRHYSVTVDTTALADKGDLGGQDAAGLGLPDTVTGEVWLNSDSLPVKVTVALDGSGSLEAHFSAYGSAVSVDAPPAHRVSTFSL